MSIPDSLFESTQAVALRYQPETSNDPANCAPTLCAKGDDELAQAIIQLALAHEIPIYENAELTRWLSQLDWGDEIPQPLYEVIAAILTLVYQLENRVPEHRR
ncbi:MAG: EscU/YscU/HrcU family type III secretion system export apparatus switch protein [Oceanobacter sp.]